MAVFRAFRAIRPLEKYAAQVAALPYDVMSSAEAREAVVGKPYSFLHVDKAEVDLPPDTDLYSDAVYAKAKANLQALLDNGICRQDDTPCVYIYRQIMDGRSQTGLVGCVSVAEYEAGIIKKHELTRADKERDRIRHVDTCDANTGPIFLTYRREDTIAQLVQSWKDANKPFCDFVSADGVQQTVWVVDDPQVVAALSERFATVPSLYIADGHHRAASAVHVGQKRRAANAQHTGEEEYNFFLAVLFAADELEIMDYNRVVKDLNGLTPQEFLARVAEKFTVTPVGKQAYRPAQAFTFGMYLDGEWYALRAKPGSFAENDPVESLDVSVLQNNLIAPVLGILDPRTDKRIDFVGGIRGLAELERRANSDMRLAFSMKPTDVAQLMAIADAGEIMPPKSTWFEPKLQSGLFIHALSE